MGACGSIPKVSESQILESSKKKNRRRRRFLRRRVSSRKIDNIGSFAETRISHSNSVIQVCSNRALDSAWFDSNSALDTESDDEFYTVYDDGLSLNGSEIASGASNSSPKVADLIDSNQSCVFGDQRQKHKVYPFNYSRNNSLLKINNSQPKDVLLKLEGPRATGEVASSHVTSDDCGLVSDTCLPCLSSTAFSIEKRRPTSPDTPNSRRILLSKLSFKWKEGSSDTTLFSPKALKQRPLAGSSIRFCSTDKQMPNSWSSIEPSSFRVRGRNYLRDKKKDFAPNIAPYYPIGADIFLSQRKINHIARFVQLPSINMAGEFPSILIVNIQIPLYSPTIFLGDNDGEGINVVLYFKLSESHFKDLSDKFQENISKFINDEVERVKSFPLDSIVPFRERLKILGRVANVEDLSLNTAEKKLMNAYNEKPVLSRPQHEFYVGENYFEIDLDVHRFSFLARKGFQGFMERLELSVLDFGLTIQGSKAEDLPEHMLCAIRLNKIDYTNYKQLGF